jgi:ubiquinone biosynthesis protein COQ4
VLNRPPPNYPGHIPLTRIERAGLAVGSAIGSLMNPYRGGDYSLTLVYKESANWEKTS